MTIKFLAPYGKWPANSIVTLDSATEAALVAGKNATTDTTGGVVYSEALPVYRDLTQAQAAVLQAVAAGAGIQSAATRPWATSAPQALGGVGASVPRHMVVRGFSETSGLTLINQDANITGTMSIDTASPLGGTALKVNIVNTAGASRYVDIQSGSSDIYIPNFKGNGRRLVFRLAVDTPANCTELSTFVGTSGLAAYWRRAHYPSTYQNATKMVFSTFPGPNTVTDTVSATDTIRQYRFRFYVAAGATVNFWVDGLYMPEKTKGYWVWTADDQTVSLATIGNILATRGMHCSFGVNQSGITNNAAAALPAYGSSAFSWADLAVLAAAGHEISSHNVTNTNISVAGLAAYLSDYRTMKWDLFQRGYLNAPYYHPCVQGISTAAGADALLADGARVHRLTCADPCEPLFRGDFLTGLPVREFSTTYQLGSATTAGTMLSYLQECIDYGVDQVGMAHLLDASAYATVQWPIGAFQQFADAVQAAVSFGQIGGAGSIGEWARYRGLGVT
jgi:hypothetical protein